MVAIDFLVNALAGTIGGVAGVYVGSPLDVIKTRMQTGAVATTSLLSSLSLTVREHGVRGLFRGAVVSAIGQIPNNFITFGAYGATLTLLSSSGRDDTLPSSDNLPSLRHVYIAGTTAGFLQTLALTPCEYIKVQQQMFRAGADGKPQGLVDIGRSILRVHGVRGLYRGWVSTILRDAGTYGVYFGSYEFLRRSSGTYNIATKDIDTPVWALLLSGGVAGCLSWLLALPADTVKSIIQAQPVAQLHGALKATHGSANAASQHSSARISTVAAGIYRQHGLRGFFRGLAPCLVRALPVNAVTFFAYESALERIEAVVDTWEEAQALEAGKRVRDPSRTLNSGAVWPATTPVSSNEPPPPHRHASRRE